MYYIAANYQGNKYINKGAKCYLSLTNGGGESYQFKVRAKGRRFISVYLSLKKIYNWRVTWLPEGYLRDVGCGYNSIEEAKSKLALIKGEG
jgi:hypothetical protein